MFDWASAIRLYNNRALKMFCDSSPVHVVPVNDLREHADSADCWCEPHIHIEPGLPAKVIIHAALDGRA